MHRNFKRDIGRETERKREIKKEKERKKETNSLSHIVGYNVPVPAN